MEKIWKETLSLLEKDPEAFYENGQLPNDLLSYYCSGLSLRTLKKLLNSTNEYKIKTALFICSELGEESCPLLPYVVKHFDQFDPVQNRDILDCVLLCSKGKNLKYFKILVDAIKHSHKGIRQTCIDYLGNATEQQLGYVLKKVNKIEEKIGLSNLLNYEEILNEDVLKSINSENKLTRIYGFSLALKKYGEDSDFIVNLKDHFDEDISSSVRTSIEAKEYVDNL